jgi:hypothetical protein
MTGRTERVSREHRIYLAVWRKAFTDQPKIIKLKASSFSAALVMRTGLYRAIRPYRFGELHDEELFQAAEGFVVSVVKLKNPKAQHEVVLKPRATLTELEAELEALGITEADLALPEEIELHGKLVELLPTSTNQTTKQPIGNKFYNRQED